MNGRPEDKVDAAIEKSKGVALRVADHIPLPLHYIFNGILFVAFLGSWLSIGFDPIPFVDEILTAAAMYFYSSYTIKRTFGALNPMRILRGTTPVQKRRLGMIPYEDKMEAIMGKLKAMKKEAGKSEIPGLSKEKVVKLIAQLKAVEKRLKTLDFLLTRPEFQEGTVKTEMARIGASMEAVEEPEVKQEFAKALEHAKSHLENIDRLKDERNRMVARLDRFRLQIDDTHSRMMASAVSEMTDNMEAERMFDELFSSVASFDDTLKELQQKPNADMLKDAVREVEETEKKYTGKLPAREKEKTL